MWDPNICLQGGSLSSSSSSIPQEWRTLVRIHGGALTEWVWPRCTNPRAFWHYAAQPWGQRKALSSPTQRSDFSLAPWEHWQIMDFQVPGLTFGFTRVNSILEPEQKGGRRRDIGGEGLVCPGHAMQRGSGECKCQFRRGLFHRKLELHKL